MYCSRMGRQVRKEGRTCGTPRYSKRARERINDLPSRCEVTCTDPRSCCLNDVAADCLAVARVLARGIRALSENKY